ncbi:MAG: cobyrinate a,c-diamide synthase [Firmicutes bacterium]|nr:cobyrinate a,c-diamide synthase [Bacillota bacterium]
MRRPRIVIAGVGSGVGKTTVTLAVMAGLAARGLRVQGFKVGPDYIDPSFHTAITGRVSRNLDTWMATADGMREVFDRTGMNADLSVIEGAMGLYDGVDSSSNDGSAAAVALLLQAPVVLVVDAWSMARSAAAVVLGFMHLEPRVRIAGVILNRVGGRGHAELVQAAIEQVCGVPVVGYLEADESVCLPERHLGLVPAAERGDLRPLFARLAQAAQTTLDLDALVGCARSARSLSPAPPHMFVDPPVPARVRIAVARDEAFDFYYPENLELLEHAGAELAYFRPLHGERVPRGASGLYIGGGFPEEFAEQLAEQAAVRESVAAAVAAGVSTLAECGGFMFLTRAIVDRSGRTHEMVGAIPAQVQVRSTLQAIGYRSVKALRDSSVMARDEVLRGHEYHQSAVTFAVKEPPHAYELTGLRGVRYDGYATPTLSAGYAHLYFGSRPLAARRWVDQCERAAHDHRT